MEVVVARRKRRGRWAAAVCGDIIHTYLHDKWNVMGPARGTLVPSLAFDRRVDLVRAAAVGCSARKLVGEVHAGQAAIANLYQIPSKCTI